MEQPISAGGNSGKETGGNFLRKNPPYGYCIAVTDKRIRLYSRGIACKTASEVPTLPAGASRPLVGVLSLQASEVSIPARRGFPAPRGISLPSGFRSVDTCPPGLPGRYLPAGTVLPPSWDFSPLRLRKRRYWLRHCRLSAGRACRDRRNGSRILPRHRGRARPPCRSSRMPAFRWQPVLS